MKHLFTALTLFIFSFSNASQIPVATAKQTAEQFTGMQSTLKEATPEYFIFDLVPQGFCIISNENNAEPVIGYSKTEPFEHNQFCNLALTNAAKEITEIRANNFAATSEITSHWQGVYLNSRSTSVDPLLTTIWGQAPHYNCLCPLSGTQRCVTGCVATAMAQIIFHYLANGSGTYKYADSIQYNYQKNIGLLTANFGPYDWVNMPYKLTADNTAVGLLMLHCGISVAMDYAPAGSGAWVLASEAVTNHGQSAQNAYVKYFGFNPYTIKAIKMGADTTNWANIIKIELDNKRPVQEAGWDILFGGHTWDIDGYDVNGLFHMNWGWEGAGNGFYRLTGLHPSNTFYLFGQNDEALIGLQPGNISPCTDITNVQAVLVAPASIKVTWAPSATALYYGVQYQDTATKVWTTLTTANNSINIPNVLGGKTYLTQVQSACSGGIGNWVKSNLVTTPPCAATSPNYSGITSDSTTLTAAWNPVPGATGYLLYMYNLNNPSDIVANNVPTANTSYKVSNLLSNHWYGFKVETTCPNSISAYSPGGLAQTTKAMPCNVPTNLKAALQGDTAVSVSWTGTNANYTLQYRDSFVTYWSTADNITATSVQIAGLQYCHGFVAQVKGNCPSSSSGYTPAIGFRSTCPACNPVILLRGTVTGNSAVVSWMPSKYANSYNAQYRVKGATGWIALSLQGTSASIANLTPATTYEYQVQALCTSGASAYVADTFQTLSASTLCPPAPCCVSVYSQGKATPFIIRWQPAQNAISYKLVISNAGKTWDTTIYTTLLQASVPLTLCASYIAKVYSVCPLSQSTAYSVANFSVSCQTATLNTDPEFTFYPNPATNSITISSVAGEVMLFDMLGRKVTEYHTEGGVTEMNLSSLKAGIYLLRFGDLTYKVIKE